MGRTGLRFWYSDFKQDDILEWSHSGYIPGFISTVSYYPKEDVTMVLLENTSWMPDDMDRVFYYHDHLRKVLIGKILNVSEED